MSKLKTKIRLLVNIPISINSQTFSQLYTMKAYNFYIISNGNYFITLTQVSFNPFKLSLSHGIIPKHIEMIPLSAYIKFKFKNIDPNRTNPWLCCLYCFATHSPTSDLTDRPTSTKISVQHISYCNQVYSPETK